MRGERGVKWGGAVDERGGESCFVGDGVLVGFEELIQERDKLLQVDLEVYQVFIRLVLGVVVGGGVLIFHEIQSE